MFSSHALALVLFLFLILIHLNCSEIDVVFAFTLDCNNNLYSCCVNDAKFNLRSLAAENNC